jgi:membrane protease subunit HflK
MSYNDPKNNDPWKGGDELPDLDDAMRDLKKKLSGMFGGKRGSSGGSGSNNLFSKIFSFVFVAFIFLWFASGFYTVNDAERGIVLRFGEFHSMSQPGLRWRIPYPVDRVELINTNVTERYIYQSTMLTRDENIVRIDLAVQYRRTDPESYLFNMVTPENTLQDVTGSAIREVIGKNDLEYILTEGRSEIAAQTRMIIQATLDEYGTGIFVFEVNLQEANFPTDVEGAVQDAIRAREDRERMAFEADAYSNNILPNARGAAARQIQDAEGYREQVIANAQGETSRFLQVLTQYQLAPTVTRRRMYIETLEFVFSNSSKVFIDAENSGNIMYLPIDQLLRNSNLTSDNLNIPVPMNSTVTNTPAQSNDPRSRPQR